MKALIKFYESWIQFSIRRAGWVLAFYAVLLGTSIYFSFNHLGINTDLSEMISDELSFHKRWVEYKEEFPYLNETILLVIESSRPSELDHASQWMASRLSDNPQNFEEVFRLNDHPFFKKNFLLYQDVENNQQAAARLKNLQPLIRSFSQNPDVAGFLISSSPVLGDPETSAFVDQLSEVFAGERQELDYQQLLLNEPDKRHFIEIKPRLNYSELLPSEPAVKTLKSFIEEYEAEFKNGIDFRVTGTAALAYEEMKSVSEGALVSSLLSLILVSLILFWALRSFQLIGITLVTLIVGLSLTAAFAALAVGHLNMISVAFAVLFIGLGVDYSIHLCLRFRELLKQQVSRLESIQVTMKDVGGSLAICTLTTAAGFFAFVPTAYKGVSELGLISGGGMVINLLIHISLFPALLRYVKMKESVGENLRSYASSIAVFSFRNAKVVRYAALGLSLCGLALVWKLDFDPNPLNLQDPTTEAYRTYRSLLDESTRSPWTIKILEKDPSNLVELERKLQSLPEVSQVLTIGSILPGNQKEKISFYRDLRFPPLKEQTVTASENEMKRGHDYFLKQLEQMISSKGLPSEHQNRLLNLYEKAKTVSSRDLFSLNESVVQPTRDLYTLLAEALPSKVVSRDDVPEDLKKRFVSNGIYRIEVFPTENVMDISSMRKFADAVLEVAPAATDDPVTLPLTGDAVVEAFFQAAIIATILILILLLLITRSVRDTVFILVPLAFSSLFLSGFMVVFGLDFNFANVIVLPLLLGIGVDSGIHMIHRFRVDGDPIQSLGASTSHGVFFSALTTIASFGTLALSTHRGTQSMGILLSVGVLVMMLSTLSILPSLLKVTKEHRLRKVA